MDTGLGRMEPVSEGKFEELIQKNVLGLFHNGQEVECNGSKFRVVNITSDMVKLRILPMQ